MAEFSFYQPVRMEFGAGKLESAGKITSSFGDSCLLVTTTNSEDVLRPLYDRVKGILEKAGVRYIHFDEVVPNPDIRGIEKAIDIVRREKLQVILAVGGGSSIDTAKAVSLFWESEGIDWKKVISEYSSPTEVYGLPGSSVLPVIAAPTTAGTGSEMTQAMIVSDHEKNMKECVYHQAVFPKVAIIDPELTRTLPPYPTAVTGFDAFTHSFESYMRELASPYTSLLGMEAMKVIIEVLPKLLKEPSNMAYREEMSRAAAFSGISLSNASASIPHPLSEVIGGVVPGIAHGQCLACLYPAFVRYQVTQDPEKCARVARLFDSSLAEVSDGEAALALPGQIEEFLKETGLFRTLSELGVTREEFDEMKKNPVLQFLPFAPPEILSGILDESYGGRV
jgi:Alcohol dehydrogenase, class IV